MFKAVHTPDNREIIILDREWEEPNKLAELRGLDRRDLLVCQECRQPVRVRAGEDRQWHFAHKQRQNCTYQSESATLLWARAALYRRLVEKFGAVHVELEKQIDSDDVPRPVDCWVHGEKGIIAYWINDGGIKPQVREALQERFKQLSIHVQWLFTASTLREQEESGRVTLTTTERELMTPTRYDAIYEPRRGRGRTLHYLDGRSVTLITLRALHLVHATHTFECCKIISPLSEVQILRQSGGLVHPGEHELWEEYDAYQKAKEAQAPQIPHSEPMVSALPPLTSFPVSIGSSHRRHRFHEGEDDLPPAPQKVGTCIFCSKETTDYWFYNGATKQCKCRACQRAGRV